MASSNGGLLLKFRDKDSAYGVTRKTMLALSDQLDIPETQVIHLALSKFAADVLPAYAPDDGPLTVKQLSALRKNAAKSLPKGDLLSKQELFA